MEIKGKVVFSSGKSGDYDIWVLDLVSQRLSQLTSGPHCNDCPRWSPDGAKIVYTSNRTGTPEIWVMDENGKNQTRLTNNGRWHETPSWSPDGKSLVFCANYDGSNIDVYTMKVDGTGLQRITDYKEMDSTPQYSPDGRNIIFISRRSGNDDIWNYDLQSKEFKQLTNCARKDFSPAYSPDGKQIAFLRADDVASEIENLDIYLMDSAGGNERRITDDLGPDKHVRWSPDGRYLIYTSTRMLSSAERLMVMDIQGSELLNLDFNRTPLENEIDAHSQPIGLFSALSEKILKKTYTGIYFGTERWPDWKF
ncbi:MAG TPA: hypothetical protein DCL44_05815 [Elusimicrobia bacterium]|nr:hypothetical protein [Elusimicrobiota bacterium]